MPPSLGLLRAAASDPLIPVKTVYDRCPNETWTYDGHWSSNSSIWTVNWPFGMSPSEVSVKPQHTSNMPVSSWPIRSETTSSASALNHLDLVKKREGQLARRRGAHDCPSTHCVPFSVIVFVKDDTDFSWVVSLLRYEIVRASWHGYKVTPQLWASEVAILCTPCAAMPFRSSRNTNRKKNIAGSHAHVPITCVHYMVESVVLELKQSSMSL